jgi:DNA-binding TFAR19-related protein (PDSD5 family)
MDEDPELQRIRMQRMQAMMKANQDAERKANVKTVTLADKIDNLLAILLAPNANQYLQSIKGRSIQVYNSIRTQLFPPSIISQIDSLMSYLQQGMIRSGIISVTEIQQMERQIMGIGSRITIKKQGSESKSLTSYLKDEE